MDDETIQRARAEIGRRLGLSRRKHGQAGGKGGVGASPEYRTWRGMKGRCLYPKHKDYARYGGRGITIDPRWLGPDGFSNFFADMGSRPEGMTIDRIDNDGPYSPANCRWTSASEQRRNHPQPRGWKRHDPKPRVYGTKSLLCGGGCGLAIEVLSTVAKVYCPDCKRRTMHEAHAAWAAKPKPPCAVDGCDRPAHTRGWCRSHYQRWKIKGDPGPATFQARRPRNVIASASPLPGRT